MCKFLQRKKFFVSPNVAANAQRIVQEHCGILTAPDEQDELLELAECPRFIDCLQPVFARFFPPGSFLLRVPPSKHELELLQRFDNVARRYIGDKAYDMTDRTVMHCLMESIFHEHQTDDGAVWEFGEALLHYVVRNAQTPAERALLADFLWNMMHHN